MVDAKNFSNPLSINITLRRQKREEQQPITNSTPPTVSINYDKLERQNNFSNFVEDAPGEPKKINIEAEDKNGEKDDLPHFHVTYWMFYPYSQVLKIKCMQKQVKISGMNRRNNIVHSFLIRKWGKTTCC